MLVLAWVSICYLVSFLVASKDGVSKWCPQVISKLRLQRNLREQCMRKVGSILRVANQPNGSLTKSNRCFEDLFRGDGPKQGIAFYNRKEERPASSSSIQNNKQNEERCKWVKNKKTRNKVKEGQGWGWGGALSAHLTKPFLFSSFWFFAYFCSILLLGSDCGVGFVSVWGRCWVVWVDICCVSLVFLIVRSCGCWCCTRQIFNHTYTTQIPTQFEYAWFTHIVTCLYIFPKFNLRILPLPVPYVHQAESQRLPIMKQTSLI